VPNTNDSETVEGMSWPIVLLVELGAPQVEALTLELESSSIIVLVETSMLRAANQVRAQRPHVVVAPASLPAERIQLLHDVAREIGIDVHRITATAAPAAVVADVRAAVSKISKSRPSAAAT
jgi:hypothetical protein